MIRVFYSDDALYIDGIRQAIVARSLTVAANGNTLSISPRHEAPPLAVGDYTTFARQDGTNFASVADAISYLTLQFSLPVRQPPIYQQLLTISEQNVIPALDKTWKSSPGALANIIINASTFTHGAGAVTFTDGSPIVTFSPQQAGFNINPGDVVVAQYSIG